MVVRVTADANRAICIDPKARSGVLRAFSCQQRINLR